MINLIKDRKWEIQFKQIVSKYMIKNGTQFLGVDVRMIWSSSKWDKGKNKDYLNKY